MSEAQKSDRAEREDTFLWWFLGGLLLGTALGNPGIGIALGIFAWGLYTYASERRTPDAQAEERRT